MDPQRLSLMKQIKIHQVAIAELNTLPPSRGVYEKKGNIFFRTTPMKAAASQQKSLDAAKATMDMDMDPSHPPPL